jgi:nucleoside-diphosphate-sugar epimerase
VRKNRRLPSAWSRYGTALTVVRGDLLEPRTIAGLEGADYVFHLGAAVMGLSEHQFNSVNEGGTANLLRAVAAIGTPIRRFVMVSSLAAAGPARDGAVPDESAVSNPVSFYGKSKLAAEAVARRLNSSQLPVTILRPCAVLGEDAADTVRLVATLARLRVKLSLVGGPEYLSVVYADDVVEALLLAAESGKTIGKTYYLSADPPAHVNDLLARAALAVGGRPFVSLPLGPRTQVAVAGINETIARLFRRRPLLTRDKVRELNAGSWTCSSSLAERDFRLARRDQHRRHARDRRARAALSTPSRRLFRSGACPG